VILTYLVSAFGKSEHEHLYPKDVEKRASVDLYLNFDLSTLYQRMLEYFFPTIILGELKTLGEYRGGLSDPSNLRRFKPTTIQSHHKTSTFSLGAPLDEAKKARLAEALGFFEAMLKNKKFSTGDDFTVADIALCVTVSQIDAFDFDLFPYPKIRKWLTECKNELEPFGYIVSLIVVISFM
jgi:glutathione S-transferase